MESWRGAEETRSMIILSLLREIHRSYICAVLVVLDEAVG